MNRRTDEPGPLPPSTTADDDPDAVTTAGRVSHDQRRSPAASAAQEEAYWRRVFGSRPYVADDETYDLYQPAYHYGVEAWLRLGPRTFEDVEAELEQGWDVARGRSTLTWDRAREAVRDVWHHVEHRPTHTTPSAREEKNNRMLRGGG